MENIGLVLSPKVILGLPSNHRNSIISTKSFVGIPNLLRKTGKNGRYGKPSSSFSALAWFQGSKPTKTIVPERVATDSPASISSSNSQETTSSVGVNPQLSVPPPSSMGSPLFWIGVGVGLSALFSWVAGRTKKYAMEQALKTWTQQMNTQNNPYGNAAFSPGFPFPFPPPTPPVPDSSITSTPMASQAVTVDVPVTKVEDPPSVSADYGTETEKGPKKYAFVDVFPEETVQKNAFEGYKESTQTDPQPVSQNGSATKSETGTQEGFSTDQIGLTPEEVISKIMANPDVAMAFQNPRVQAAIMEDAQGNLIETSTISGYYLQGDGDLFKAPQPVIEEPGIGIDPVTAAIFCGENEGSFGEGDEKHLSEGLSIMISTVKTDESSNTDEKGLEDSSFQKSISSNCLSSLENLQEALLKPSFLDSHVMDEALYGIRRSFSEGDLKNELFRCCCSPLGLQQRGQLKRPDHADLRYKCRTYARLLQHLKDASLISSQLEPVADRSNTLLVNGWPIKIFLCVLAVWLLANNLCT